MTDHLDEKFVHPVESQRCVSSNHGVAIFSIRPFLHFFVRCQFHALRLTHFHSDKIQHKRRNKWCKLRFSIASCCLMYDCDVQHRPFEWYVRCRLDKLIDYIRSMVMNCHCFVEAILHAIQCEKMTSKSEGPYHWRGEWNIDGSWDERNSLKSHRWIAFASSIYENEAELYWVFHFLSTFKSTIEIFINILPTQRWDVWRLERVSQFIIWPNVHVMQLNYEFRFSIYRVNA